MAISGSQGGLNDFLDALGARESSNDYSAVNSYGYLGRYQFGELALIDAGYYAAHDGTSANDFAGAWTGRLGVTSKAEFLANPDAQDDAAEIYITKLWSYIRALDLEFYAGQTLNDVELTISGMVGGAWLVGAGGVATFISSGGTTAPGDAYATLVTEYITLLNNYDLSSLADFVTNLEKDNSIAGGSEADVLKGEGGDDTLSGAAGDDVLVGGAGSDNLSGGDGNDGIWAGADDDAGDSVCGDAGDDTIGGGIGNDSLYGEAGSDVLFGGSGNDFLSGGGEEDTAWAGNGSDTVWGGSGADIIGGGAGNDRLAGGSGSDTIYSSAGDDEAFGADGNDEIYGGDGNDTLTGGAGDDSLFGGDGENRFLFDSNHGDDFIGGFMTDGVDLIDLSALELAGFGVLEISQSGGDVLIGTGEGTITLWAVSITDVTEQDFVF